MRSSSSILVRYRNREIRSEDISFIKSQMELNPKFGRTHLSKHLWEIWDWRGPGGQLKEFACRDLLLRLEEWGHICLPKRRVQIGRRKSARDIPMEIDTTPVTELNLKELEVRPIFDAHTRKLWRVLMDRYHYLGEGVMCGEHMHYLAFVGDQVVAALGWGAASLRNPKRDKFMGWSDFIQTKAHLHEVVNNLRFLIFPWVQVKNLGTRVLSLNLKRLNDDWRVRYNHEITLAETFVDTSRFKGTV